MKKTENKSTQGAAISQEPDSPGISQTPPRSMLKDAHEQRKDSIPVLTIGNLQNIGRVFGAIRERLLVSDDNANHLQESSDKQDDRTTESGNTTGENSRPDTTGEQK